MLTSISLAGFKCFRSEQVFPLSKINVLTGVNGRGKSSLLQSLLIFSQTVSIDRGSNVIILNGELINLGGFDDLKNVDISAEGGIDVVFEYDEVNSNSYAEIKYQLTKSYLDEELGQVEDDGVAKISSLTVSGSTLGQEFAYEDVDVDNLHNLLPSDLSDDDGWLRAESDFMRIHYVSADRIGPSSFHEAPTKAEFNTVGKRGENTANIIYKYRELDVNQGLRNASAETYKLPDQLVAWIAQIFSGGTIKVDHIDQSLKRILMNADGSSRVFRPENVGFGYSYSLPIVVAGLTARAGDILIVENPEAHLHPSAQSKLVRFLSLVARSGVQVFIETHSQSVLNSTRIAIKSKDIGVEDISVLFFSDNKDNPVLKIPVGDDGRIDSWPEGFFDQYEKDLDQIYDRNS